MNAWPVNIVSAFGRGETLALALQENGFDVQILDFTSALGGEWNQGGGPFPIAAQTYLPAQKQLLEEVRPLERGLTFWLPEGPLELGGQLATFFDGKFPAAHNLRTNSRAQDFEYDWLRRFMKTWASAFVTDSWSIGSGDSTFPYADMIGLIPATKADRVMSFERFQTLGYKVTACTHLHDVQLEGGRITGLEAEAGRASVFEGAQWIWCLSSEESAKVGAEVANQIFAQHIRKPEWRWLSLQGHCERGPWSLGFPEYIAVIDDIHLPWNYTNLVLLRWTDADVFRAWIRVPDVSYRQVSKRVEWADEIAQKLSARLALANWKVDSENWSLCPHSPVFAAGARDERQPSWKNWDWIAPETTSRLDLSARLEREGQAYHRLIQWRNEQIKKQGAHRDHALHAP